MSALRAFLRRIGGIFGKERRERELAAELESHLRMHVEDNVRNGMTEEEARRDALLRLGGLEQTKESVRDRRGIPLLEAAAQDVRYGARVLRKNPAFTAVATLTLALGIGANTALFSVVNGVLMHALPYPDADRILTLHESKPNFEAGSLSYPNFRDWQRENRTFSSMAVERRTSFNLFGRGEAEQVRGLFVSSDFFPILGVQPVIGRTFGPGEDEIGARPIALISENLWRRKFSGDPNIAGSSIDVDGAAYTVVGVVPGGFELTLRSTNRPDVFLPIGQWGNNLLTNRSAGLGIHGIGRLRPGVTAAQAREDLNRVARNLAAAYPEKDKGVGATVIPLRQIIVGEIRPFLLALFAAVGFVLLIACVNVANLLLARSASRSREFSIRTALGAGRGRIVRQLLTESVLLSIAGGALGLLLASRGTRIALDLLGGAVPRASEVGMDGRVLAFTAVVSALAGILFGLAPSLRTSRRGSAGSLHEVGRGAASAGHGAQSIFIVLELAMALVLLIGAGLMIRTLSRLWNVDPGFNPKNVLTFNLSLPPEMGSAPPEAIRAAVRDVDRALASTPGVEAASLSWASLPMKGDDEQLFWPDGQPKPDDVNDMNWALKYVVEPEYGKAAGLRLKRGRFLAPSDDERAPLTAVIDDVFAARYFGNANPVGRRLNLDDFETPATVVGVVGHVKQWGLEADDTQKLRAQLYLSYPQMPDSFVAQSTSGMDVVVRSKGSPSALFPAIRRALRNGGRGRVVSGARTMEDIISDSLSPRRYSMILLGAFAALALVLSAIGIYGVISFAVGQRKGEIGIRVALGAQRGEIVRLILSQGGKLAAMGIGLGILGAFGLTRLMSRLLFGVSAVDPVTFAGMAAVLGAVALLACYLPARTAAALDPITVLRAE